MKVLAISYGKNFYEPTNAERARVAACAREAGELHAVIFSSEGDGFSDQSVNEHFFLYPTNSKHNFGKVVDAIAVGKKIIMSSSSSQEWVITAQDPFESALVAWRISKATGVPFNIQEHGDFFSTRHWASEPILNKLRGLFGKFILKRANSVRVVSERIKKTLIGLGVRTDKIDILSVRTDTTSFTNAKPNTALIPDYDAGKKYILTVARFVPQKNLSLLIKSFSKVQSRFPTAHLLMVGRGKEETELKQLARKMLPADSYTFMSWSEDVPTLMATAHIYALSSNYEGWGRVLIEAQAAGMPIVTTNVGCVGEAVLESGACQVVPVASEPAFVDALVSTLENWTTAKEQALTIKQSTETKAISNEAYAKEWTNTLKKTIATRL